MDSGGPTTARPERGRHGQGGGEATRRALLNAARAAFARRGLEGARVDDIAKRAKVNKQLVYHYFGSKDGLYTAVLEDAYEEIRQQEQGLDLSARAPEEAMRRLIEFSFDYLAGHREFVALIADENTHRGRHIDASPRLEEMNRPIIDLIRQTLERGEGAFRPGLDPLQVYLSIAGLSYFYFANIHTLSRIFGEALTDADAVARRRRHVVEFALAALRAPK